MVLWGITGALLWGPYWRELNATGWIRVQDVGTGYLLAFGPWIIGTIYFASFCLVRLAQTKGFRISLFRRLLVGWSGRAQCLTVSADGAGEVH